MMKTLAGVDTETDSLVSDTGVDASDKALV
jgi:hypothetical protein